MPVTIGEFEVVSEPPATPAAAATASAAPPAAPDPLELQQQLQGLHEAALRVWAH
jgi:hypothetical protein